MKVLKIILIISILYSTQCKSTQPLQFDYKKLLIRGRWIYENKLTLRGRVYQYNKNNTCKVYSFRDKRATIKDRPESITWYGSGNYTIKNKTIYIDITTSSNTSLYQQVLHIKKISAEKLVIEPEGYGKTITFKNYL